MVGSALDITCALVLNTHYQSSEKIQDSFAQVFMNVSLKIIFHLDSNIYRFTLYLFLQNILYN